MPSFKAPGPADERERFTGGVDKETGEKLLQRDVGTAERAVLRFTRVPLTEGQFDALVSFTFMDHREIVVPIIDFHELVANPQKYRLPLIFQRNDRMTEARSEGPRLLMIVLAHRFASSSGRPCMDPDRSITSERLSGFLAAVLSGASGA
tara:strand:- start:130 stop:579 length:450 start_codon:yes stop_codon:yes gene_type:complete